MNQYTSYPLTLTEFNSLFAGSLVIPVIRVTSRFTSRDIFPAVSAYILFPSITSVLTLWTVELLPTVHRVCMMSILIAVKCTLTAFTSFFMPPIDSWYSYFMGKAELYHNCCGCRFVCPLFVNVYDVCSKANTTTSFRKIQYIFNVEEKRAEQNLN